MLAVRYIAGLDTQNRTGLATSKKSKQTTYNISFDAKNSTVTATSYSIVFDTLYSTGFVV